MSPDAAVISAPRAHGVRSLYWLVSAMVFFWSANYIVAKIALREMPALLVTGLRIGFAGLIMIPIYWWQSRRDSAGREWTRSDVPMLVLLGICGVALNQMFFVIGISRTTVAHSAIVIGLTPVCVLAIAAAAKMERITVHKVAGMAIAIAGVAILQAFRSQEKGSHPTVLGDFFVFLAAVTFALFTVLGKSVSLRHGPVTVNTFAYLGGAIALLPVTLWQAHGVALGTISRAAWLSVLYMAMFPSVVCYLIYYYVLTRLSASRVSAFSYLQPLLATLMAVAVLGERVTLPVMAGGSIIFAGVFLTERG